MSNIVHMSNLAPSPSFVLGGGDHGTPSSSNLLAPKTSSYTDPYAGGPSIPIRMDPLSSHGLHTLRLIPFHLV